MNLEQISASELRKRLNEGVVGFAFKKKDGSLRLASGTRDLSQIPKADHPSGGLNPRGNVSYYDLNAKGWRSVSVSGEVFSSNDFQLEFE